MGGLRPRAVRGYLTLGAGSGPARCRSPRSGPQVAFTPRRPVASWRSSVAKLSFLAGLGAGYVLGARAGRERYEQIKRAWEHAKDDPKLQSLAGMAQAKADDAVSTLKAQLGSEPPR